MEKVGYIWEQLVYVDFRIHSLPREDVCYLWRRFTKGCLMLTKPNIIKLCCIQAIQNTQQNSKSCFTRSQSTWEATIQKCQNSTWKSNKWGSTTNKGVSVVLPSTNPHKSQRQHESLLLSFCLHLRSTDMTTRDTIFPMTRN